MTEIGTRSFSKMVSNNRWLVSCGGKHDKNSSSGGRWRGSDGEAGRRKKLQNSITNRSSPLDNNKLAIQRTNTTSLASNEKKDDNSTKAKQKPQQQVNHQSKKDGGVCTVDNSISSTNKYTENNVICNKNDCNDIDFSPHDKDYDTIIRIKSEDNADDFVHIDDFLIDDDDNTNATVAANLRESGVSLAAIAAAETVTATKNITINRQSYQAEVDEWEFIAPPLQPPHSNCSRSTTTTPIAIGTHCKTHCLSPSCTLLSICQLYQITPTKLRQMNPSLLLLHSNDGEWGSGMVGTSLSGGRSSPSSCREEKNYSMEQCCCATTISSSASLEKQQQPKALLIPISEKCNKDQLFYKKQQPSLPKSKNKNISVSCTVAMATTVYKQQHDIENGHNAICSTFEDDLIQLFQKGISSSFLKLSSESNAGCCPHCILSFFQQKRIADLYLNIAADLLRDDNNNIKHNCVVKDAIKNALHDVNWEMQPQPTEEGFVRLLHKTKNHSKLLVQTPEITSNKWSIIERNNSKNGNNDEFSTDDVLVQKPSTLDCRIVHLKAAAVSAFFNQSRSNNNNKLLVPAAEQMYSSPMMMNDGHTNTTQINYNHLKQQQQQLHQQPTLQHGVEMITLTE